jgi:hypothetical protein
MTLTFLPRWLKMTCGLQKGTIVSEIRDRVQRKESVDVEVKDLTLLKRGKVRGQAEGR